MGGLGSVGARVCGWRGSNFGVGGVGQKTDVGGMGRNFGVGPNFGLVKKMACVKIKWSESK